MISREEAIGILSNQAQNAVIGLDVIPELEKEMTQALMNEIEALDMAIEALSQPERPKGQWIGMPRMGVHDMCCSNCRYSSGIRFWNSPYCPNCGAEMER